MRKQDIKLGVVYAFQRGEWDTPRPVVFLSLDLYRSRRGSGAGWCEPAASYDSRPKRGKGFSGYDVGYPAVEGKQYGREAGVLAVMGGLRGDLIGKPLPDDLREAGLGVTLITRLASITGVYDEVVTEQQKRRQHDAELTAAREREARQRDARMASVAARLGALGLTVCRDYGAPDVLTVSLDEAEKIADRVEVIAAITAPGEEGQ